MEILEEWAEELKIEVLTWHELTLLKSFAEWLREKYEQENADDKVEDI